MAVLTTDHFLDYLPLCKRAWAEVSKEPFNPDLELFRFSFEHGLMFGDIDNHGFYIFALNKDFFTSKLRADVLTIWVRPEYRNTSKSVRLYFKMIKEAKAKGAQSIVYSVPVASDNVFSWSYHYGNPSDFIFKRNL